MTAALLHTPTPDAPRSAAARALRALGPTVTIAIAWTTLHLAWLATHVGPPAWRVAIADLFFAPDFLLCALAAFATARKQLLDVAGSRRFRRYRAWQLVGLSYLVLQAGNLVWYYYDIARPGEPLSDWVGFLTRLSYLPFLIGLLMLPTAPRQRTERAALVLDTSTVLLGAGGFIWYLLLRPKAELLVHGGWSIAADFFTPAADLAVITVLAAILFRGPDADNRSRLRWMLAGHTLSVSAGVVYGYFEANGIAYAPGDPLDAIWSISNVLILIGVSGPPAVRQRVAQRTVAPSGGTEVDLVRHSLVPYAFVLVGLALLAVASRPYWHTALGPVVAIVSAIALLVVVRQVMVLLDNERLLADRLAQDARFRSLVQHSSDITVVIDREGFVRYQSPSSERLLGQSAARLERRPLVDQVHADDVQPLCGAVADLTAGRTAAALIARLRHASGEWRPFEVVGTNLLDDPTVGGLVLNFRDVGERLALEERLRRAEQLEAVGRLAGGIAHDFNNLLTVVRSNAEMIRAESAPDDPRRQFAREIEDAARRSAALTRQLLSFSRRQVVRPQRLDLGRVLADMDALLRRAVGPDVALAVRHAPGLWPVHADPVQLEQVMMNLAVNARDAMRAGGALTVATANATLDDAAARALAPLRAGDYVTLTVRDTGSGMPPEVLAHLFEPFFTTKPQGEGTGLGLSTVFGIAKQAGGHVAVASEIGVGSVFTVFLPRVAGSLPLPIVAAPTPPIESSARPEGSALVALVTDDEDGVRTATSRILQRVGYVVLSARHGAEALAVADAYPGAIHVLVTDVMMPVMGGRELAERFAERRPAAGIVFLSGYTNDPAIAALADAPGRAFVEKPFTVERLRTAMREVLEVAATA